MERLTWQEAWRAICRDNNFTRMGLEALAIACEKNDPRIDLCLPSGVFPSRGARIVGQWYLELRFTNDDLPVERFDPLAFVAMEGREARVAKAHTAYLICFRRLGYEVITPWFQWSELESRETVLRELASLCRQMLSESWS